MLSKENLACKISNLYNKLSSLINQGLLNLNIVKDNVIGEVIQTATTRASRPALAASWRRFSPEHPAGAAARVEAKPLAGPRFVNGAQRVPRTPRTPELLSTRSRLSRRQIFGIPLLTWRIELQESNRPIESLGVQSV